MHTLVGFLIGMTLNVIFEGHISWWKIWNNPGNAFHTHKVWCEFSSFFFRLNVSARKKKHMRIHTKQKPYQCENYKKMFWRYNKHEKHKRIHIKEKPYQCQLSWKLQVKINLRAIIHCDWWKVDKFVTKFATKSKQDYPHAKQGYPHWM